MTSYYVWVPILIAAASFIIIFFRKEEAKKLGDTASSIFTLIISSIWLPIWAFIQWAIGELLSNINLQGLDEWFLIIFRVLFALVTLIIVLIEIYTNIKMTWIISRRKIKAQEEK